MKKCILTALVLSGIAHGADSWLTRVGNAAGNIAFYPIKVILDKGPRFLKEEAPGLCELIDTPEKATVAVTVSTVALIAGGLVLGPVTLVLAPVGVIALDLTQD